ncbi:MAG TPA: acyl-CoA desaturase [Blastocatellia bacterium]|nr:acyl-CoA desaturase [Blastocatellia bacterium]
MRHELDERIDLLGSLPFLSMHLACLLAIQTGVSVVAVAVCLALYGLRMFGITAGYHRYFSHRSYKTSRAFQFVVGWLGAMAAQKGPLWWASHHRRHHGYSDTADDVHSPVVGGFWWSHVGWFLCGKYNNTDIKLIKDLARYPELQFLNRFYALPPAALAIFMLALGRSLHVLAPALNTSATQMLVWGFLISTVLVYHGTFAVNSLAHIFGRRRFPTKDDSRNNILIALITLGEGWHNNHHYAPSSERQGFYWWEIDVSHYILKALSWCGLVWDLQAPPSRVYRRR